MGYDRMLLKDLGQDLAQKVQQNSPESGSQLSFERFLILHILSRSF